MIKFVEEENLVGARMIQFLTSLGDGQARVALGTGTTEIHNRLICIPYLLRLVQPMLSFGQNPLATLPDFPSVVNPVPGLSVVVGAAWLVWYVCPKV